MSENKKALAICKHKYRVEMFWLLIQSDLVNPFGLGDNGYVLPHS